MTKNNSWMRIGDANGIREHFKKFRNPWMKKAVNIAFVFLAVLLGWIILLEYFMADKYQVSVKVGDKTEMDVVNADVIDYGTLAKGESVARFITVENRGGRSMYVKTWVVGDISDILKTDNKDFMLFPQEKVTVQLLLEIPRDADKVQYKGRVIVFKFPAIF